MRNISVYALWLLGAIVLSTFACAPAYVPNVVSTPLLGEKGEFVGSVNYGIAGFDPQIAFAFTDQIGIIANGSFRNYTSDSTDNYHKHQFFELGGGYHTMLGEVGRFEAYGGFGGGKLNAEFDNALFVTNADTWSTRVFVQPSIGLVTDVVEFAFTPRVVFVTLTQDKDRLYAPFLEPALTLKLGYREVKGVMQLGFSVPFTTTMDLFPYQPFLFSMGLQLRLNTADL